MANHYSPTGENPYAWDLQPWERTELKPYERFYMEYVRKLTQQLTIFGGLISFLFFYLIVFRTAGELRKYRPIFLICSLTDLFFYGINTFVEIKSKMKDGVFMLRLEGPAQRYSREVQLYAVSVFVATLGMAITVLPAQFYYRYYTLTRGKPLPIWKTMFIFSISYMVGVPMAILAYYSYGFGAPRKGLNYGQLWYPDTPLPLVFYADTRDPVMMLYFGWGGTVITVAYMVLLYIAYRTLKHFNMQAQAYSRKAKSMQKQLTWFLIIQSVIPIFVSSGPNVFLVITAFLRIDAGILTTIVVDFMGLLPVCNPFLSILVIKPYRRIVGGVFKKQKVPAFSVTSVSR
ncbi:unnamed protein product [Bursaphelenchus xylophilus]|uniref:(pine wood nematode) hypothetical protein n=1 Tax=Bursaphelenchus xylophilus TaxID=6326 RepID=A0A1I7SEF5_BURXY|nr:unnamed protein product [Bursaphelenchus xylophilus]CAG9103998.1 unnamed protein product [Bursaphelenchus xylophilus]